MAAFLFLLAASPFTAPFATCDLSTLFGGHPTIAKSAGAFTTAFDDQSADAACAAPRRLRIEGTFVARTHIDTHARATLPGGSELLPEFLPTVGRLGDLSNTPLRI